MAEAPFAIDFSTAKLLSSSGSTCDAYECTVQHRRVFVKRLKEEYRNNPMYRAAFSKEYDLGVTLSHPSLPHYIGFGGDYIVMDYIEGDTLSSLISRCDIRLTNEKAVKKLLRELIDVVEYLHNRNIIHCDIKSDNIIISPYPDRPAILIDLDKAYSPWLDSTHGDTARYGCDQCADGDIDYKGVGMIAAKLGMKRIADACNRNNVSADGLKKLLENRSGRVILPVIIAGVIIAAIVAVMALVTKPTSSHHDAPSDAGYAAPAAADSEQIAYSPIAPGTPSEPEKPAIDNAWIDALISEKSAEIIGYRQKLLGTLGCDTISIADKYDAITAYTYSAGMARNQIIFSAVEHYRHLSEIDVQQTVRNNPGWVRLDNEEAEMQRRIKQWQTKVSRRSSSLPASLPDTNPDEPLPAPHR